MRMFLNSQAGQDPMSVQLKGKGRPAVVHAPGIDRARAHIGFGDSYSEARPEPSSFSLFCILSRFLLCFSLSPCFLHVGSSSASWLHSSHSFLQYFPLEYIFRNVFLHYWKNMKKKFNLINQKFELLRNWILAVKN